MNDIAIRDQIETLLVESLVPYARNSRTHSPEQVAQIAASMREFGFTNPVLIDDAGGIIAGHGRVLAAQSLGLQAVPCLRLTGLSEAQKRAYIIADNKLAENAGWDDEILRLELIDLQEMEYDLGLIGFDDAELAELLADPGTPEGATDPDAVPETPVDPITCLGDVWLLGRHRIVCGDSTNALTVEAALAGSKPHLMVTDPPYGVEYDPDWRNQADLANGKSYGARATGQVLNDDIADWREAWALFPGDVAYVWHAGKFAGEVQDSLQACGFELRCQIIWAKPRFAISRGHYHWQHEPCWYAVRKNTAGGGHWQGDRSQTTLWSITHNKSETGHGTQKPVECMRKPIENNSRIGDHIYEPFSGSGTTIIAAEQTARICHAIELNPAYVDVTVRRWQQFTGQRATLESTGQPFPE